MQALSNDELRAKTKELQKYVQEYAKEEKATKPWLISVSSVI